MNSRGEIPEPEAKDSFAWRLWWVMKNRYAGNAAEMARATGLDRTHIRNTIVRGSDMSAPNAYAVHRASGVSLAWLSSGNGDPGDAAPGDDFVDPIPARREAVNLARLKSPRRVSEGAIQAARQLSTKDKAANYGSWSRAQWAELLLEITIDESKNNPATFRELGGMDAIREGREKAKMPKAPESRPAKPAKRKAG